MLEKRKGFIRIALQSGASLVPVIAFGENDLFRTYVPRRGSQAAHVQRRLQKVVGTASPVFWGSGFLLPEMSAVAARLSALIQPLSGSLQRLGSRAQAQGGAPAALLAGAKVCMFVTTC